MSKFVFLPQLPMIDPADPGQAYQLEGEIKTPAEVQDMDDRLRVYTDRLHIYFYRILPMYKRDRTPEGKLHRTDEVEWVQAQREFPIQFAAWFLESLERFKKKPSEGGLPAGKISDSAWVQDEWVGMNYGAYGGYSISNLSREERNSPTMPQGYMLPMELLFQRGLIDIFRQIADRYPAVDVRPHEK